MTGRRRGYPRLCTEIQRFCRHTRRQDDGIDDLAPRGYGPLGARRRVA